MPKAKPKAKVAVKKRATKLRATAEKITGPSVERQLSDANKKIAVLEDQLRWFKGKTRVRHGGVSDQRGL